jgi:PAS domain S-box-containing protein
VGEVLVELLDAEPQVLIMIERNPDRLVFLSGPVEEFLGVSRERLTLQPDSWAEHLAAAERAGLASFFAELDQGRRVTRCFHRTRPDTTPLPLRATVFRRKTGTRTLDCAIVVRLDESGVSSLPILVRTAMESISEGVTVANPEGNFIFANREAAAIFGFRDTAALLGRSWRDLYPERELRRIEQEFLPLLLRDRRWHGRLRGRRQDDREITVALTLAQLPGNETVCTFHDVTRQVEIAEQLSRSEATFREFLENLSAGVLIQHPGGDPSFRNQAWQRFFGPDELPSFATSFPPPPAPPSDSAPPAPPHRLFDWPQTTPDGPRILAIEHFPLPRFNAKEPHACFIATDVTERRRLELEAEEVIRRNAAYLVMQREFVSMVSHEFRTPLTAIQGAHFLLGEKTKKFPDADRAAFERLLDLQTRALDSLNALVDQVLLLNRIEHSSAAPARERRLLAPFVSHLIDYLNTSIAVGRIVLTVEVPPDYLVEIDPAQIRIALENLLSNSLKYSDAARPVAVGLTGDDTTWTLTVSDRGRGIPPEDQAALFTAFTRARNVGTVPGTGLGLAIVRRVVANHRGTVSFESEIGQGSTFRLSLPRTLSRESFAAPTGDSGPAGPASARTLPVPSP